MYAWNYVVPWHHTYSGYATVYDSNKIHHVLFYLLIEGQYGLTVSQLQCLSNLKIISFLLLTGIKLMP